MTIRDRVMSCVHANADFEGDSLEKLIAMAYWIGREEAVVEVSDIYGEHLHAQTERARASRFHAFAERILDNGPGYIYHPDYSKEMSAAFGGDETAF